MPSGDTAEMVKQIMWSQFILLTGTCRDKCSLKIICHPKTAWVQSRFLTEGEWWGERTRKKCACVCMSFHLNTKLTFLIGSFFNSYSFYILYIDWQIQWDKRDKKEEHLILRKFCGCTGVQLQYEIVLAGTLIVLGVARSC